MGSAFLSVSEGGGGTGGVGAGWATAPAANNAVAARRIERRCMDVTPLAAALNRRACERNPLAPAFVEESASLVDRDGGCPVAAPSWPTSGSSSLPVTIDHILAPEGATFGSFDTRRIAGTDHRAIAATLSLPSG